MINQKSKSLILASALAVLVGLMTAKSGSSILLGISKPNQIILYWLVSYNVIFAFFSIITGIFIWMEKAISKNLSMVILAGHSLVLVILISIYFINQNVAPKSIGAMSFRSVLWLVIFILIRNRLGGK